MKENYRFIFVIRVLIIILPTNLIIILIKTKNKMPKLDAMGISSYHQSLPRGEKDLFVRRIAETIDKSTPSVYRKLASGTWTSLEIAAIEELINK